MALSFTKLIHNAKLFEAIPTRRPVSAVLPLFAAPDRRSGLRV
jgi:hypothetical protein